MDMRPSIWPSVAVFGGFAISLLLVVPAPAQINGPPASVTSPGFGGNAVNGPRSSVTSLGPQGYAPPPRFTTGIDGHRGNRDGHHGDGNRDGGRHHHGNDTSGPIWYAVPVPYAPEYSPASAPDEEQPDDTAEDDADYQGGPTVFDRRGSGERSYVPPAREAAPAHAPARAEAAAPPLEPDPPLAPTLLVFKDGRTVEVGNYAIQGQMLYDLTPGHRRKIMIADLDLDATRKQNDERGVTFQLPQSTKVN